MEDFCKRAVLRRRLDVLSFQLTAGSEEPDQRKAFRNIYATDNQRAITEIVAEGPAVIIGGAVLDIQARAAFAWHQIIISGSITDTALMSPHPLWYYDLYPTTDAQAGPEKIRRK